MLGDWYKRARNLSRRTVPRRWDRRGGSDRSTMPSVTNPIRPSLAIRQWAAGLTGLLVGLAGGAFLWEGNYVALGTAIVTALALAALLRLLIPAGQRTEFAIILAVAYALRLAAVGVLRAGSLASGRGGFVTGDDEGYAVLSWAYVQYLNGTPLEGFVPPFWNGMGYLFGTYVYFESLIFAVFGPNVAVVQVLNSGFAVVSLILLADIARRLFGRGPALTAFLLGSFFPSLVLWSALNLKDALALFLISSVLWLLGRFYERPRLLLLAVAYLTLLPMSSLRAYLYFGLAFLIPVSVAIAPLRLSQRALWSAVAASLTLLLLVASRGGNDGQTLLVASVPEQLSRLEAKRQDTAYVARSAFQDRLLRVQPGETYVVQGYAPPGIEATFAQPSPSPQNSRHGDASPTPPVQVAVPGVGAPSPTAAARVTPTPNASPTPSGLTASRAPAPPTAESQAAARHAQQSEPSPTAPTRTPDVFVIAPGTKVAVVAPNRPMPTNDPSTVYVRSGDVVVIGPAGSTPAPPEQHRKLYAPIAVTDEPGDEPLKLTVEADDPEAVIVRTLRYLPKGLSYALFAPFPWAPRRALDLLTVPEMLAWYLVLFAAVVTLWRERLRLRALAPIALYVGLVVVVLALAEGNVGILFRHRAMLIQYTMLLAAPTLLDFVERARQRLGPG